MTAKRLWHWCAAHPAIGVGILYVVAGVVMVSIMFYGAVEVDDNGEPL